MEFAVDSVAAAPASADTAPVRSTIVAPSQEEGQPHHRLSLEFETHRDVVTPLALQKQNDASFSLQPPKHFFSQQQNQQQEEVIDVSADAAYATAAGSLRSDDTTLPASYSTASSFDGIGILPRSKPVGLKNMGNTCYMNVLIQKSFHIVPFRNAILDGSLLPVSEMAEIMGQYASCPAQVGMNTSLNPIKVARGLHRLKVVFGEMVNTRNPFVNPAHFIDALGFKYHIQEASHKVWENYLNLTLISSMLTDT